MVESAIKIRKAGKADVPALYRLSRSIKEIAGSTEMDRYTLLEIKKWVSERDKIWLVAESVGHKKKELVGFLFAIFVSHDWCMLEGFGVKPGRRRQGIGTQLFRAIISIAKEKKVNHVQAYTNISDRSAQKFWKKQGFGKGKTFYWFDKAI